MITYHYFVIYHMFQHPKKLVIDLCKICTATIFDTISEQIKSNDSSQKRGQQGRQEIDLRRQSFKQKSKTT
jgi:hypothetical protein